MKGREYPKVNLEFTWNSDGDKSKIRQSYSTFLSIIHITS